MKSPARGLSASTVLLAAALGLGLSGPHRAQAAPATPTLQTDGSVAVSILSPTPRQAFDGVKPVEISAFYQGSTGNQVVSIELFVDGNKAAQKVLDAPETRGVVSFLVDASALTSGPHRIVVRVTGADAEIASAHTSFTYEAPAPVAAAPAPENAAPRQIAPLQNTPAPTLSILPPRGMEDGQVQGTIKLRVQATDPSGKAPYVSLFIDRQFKTLRNYAPYEFDWDTTTASNGYHTIEAFGYNDAQAVGHAQSLRVFVNNPGGRTERRTDLLDASPAKHAPKSARASVTARKAKSVARRPQAPLLAVSKAMTPGMGRASGRLRMAQVFALIQRSARLTEMPSLPAPFVGDASLPTSVAVHPATVKAVRPVSALPTRGFKPFTHAANAGMSGALLALTPSTHPLRPAGPRLMRLAPAGLTGAALSSEFVMSPTLPTIKATVGAHTTLSAGPRKSLRVLNEAPLTRRALRVHIPKMAAQINWLRAVGQSTVLFNSSRLPLDRPLTAQGSVMFGPLRQIFQQGGGSLMWQARTGVVHARSQNRDVLLTIGKKSALVNNAVVMLDGKPYLNDGRTMIPLSFLKQAMNVDVQYDAESGHLVITSKP